MSEELKSSKRQTAPKPPPEPGMARIIAIANQKGGVGKSTTAVSLGAALADLGYRVLVVDLDPQGNASTGLGIRHEARETTVYDVIVSQAPITDAIVHTAIEGLHAVPSTIDLAGAEIELVSQFSREARLKKAFDPVREGIYDFIFIDCPPSLGLLTVNALTAAEELIVPIQCEYYALEGLGQLLRNVSLVQQNINNGLRLSGLVMTMFDPRTRLSEQVVEEVQRYFGELVYDVIIPRTVRLSEAPGFGQPITLYDPKSKGALCYRQLAQEVASRPPPAEPMPVFEDLPTVSVQAVEGSVMPAPFDEAELGEVPTVHELLDESTGTVGGLGGPERANPDEPSPEIRLTEGVSEGSAPAGPEFGVAASEGIPDREPSAPPASAEVDPRPEESHRPEVEAETWLHELAVDAEGEEPPSTGEILSDAVAEVVEQMGDDELWEEEPEEIPSRESRVSTPHFPTQPGQLPERRVVVIDEGAADHAGSEMHEAGRPGAVEGFEGEATDIGATLEDETPSLKRRWRLFRKGGE
jgi:chromosome partitioning protein